MKDFFYSKLILPLLAFIKTGMSPEKLAIGISLGFVLGIIPFIGVNTILCAICAYVFRINLGVIQLVNYFVYPLQLLLFAPFIKFGIYIFGANSFPYPIEDIWERLQLNFTDTLSDIWWANLLGVLIWLICAPLLYGVCYYSCKYFIANNIDTDAKKVTQRD